MAVKCNKTVIREESPLTLKITGGTTSVISKYTSGNISSLKLPEGITLRVGQILTLKKYPYRINRITSKIVNERISYYLHTADRTKSSLYVLPMLGKERKDFLYDQSLLNCFLYAEGHSKCIALLYKFSGTTSFLKFEQSLKDLETYKATYDPSTRLVLFVFDVPEDYKDNYDLFIKGKYSEFTNTYKLRILDFHRKGIESEMAQVLFRHPERRKVIETALDISLKTGAELLSIPDTKTETFDKTIYI